MFSLTIKSNYAIKAILILVENYEKKLVKIKDITKKTDIPKNYLEQIFNRLGKNEIISSIRGSKGGYKLAINPKDITLFELLETLEGKLELNRTKNLESVANIYLELETLIKEKLSITLLELYNMQKKHEDIIIYYI